MSKDHARITQALHLALAGVAFGVIEGAVVMYLRQISYPEGFAFPLAMPPALVLRTELVREVATLLLLAGIAGACARSFIRRFAIFGYLFGIWDLIYYATLKVALDWPASLMTWDVLFLIPAPWASPVLAPILVSLALVAGGLSVLLMDEALPMRSRFSDWILGILGAGIMLASFLWNAGALTRGGAGILGVPGAFPWWLFAAGWLIACGGALRLISRLRAQARRKLQAGKGTPLEELDP